MKIILTAFCDKLKSDIMEYPDNTSIDFWIPLPFDQTFGFNIGHNDLDEIVRTPRGRFQHTGKYFMKHEEAIAIYALVELVDCKDDEISKLKKERDDYEDEAQRRNINSLKGSDFGRITGH